MDFYKEKEEHCPGNVSKETFRIRTESQAQKKREKRTGFGEFRPRNFCAVAKCKFPSILKARLVFATHPRDRGILLMNAMQMNICSEVWISIFEKRTLCVP